MFVLLLASHRSWFQSELRSLKKPVANLKNSRYVMWTPKPTCLYRRKWFHWHSILKARFVYLPCWKRNTWIFPSRHFNSDHLITFCPCFLSAFVLLRLIHWPSSFPLLLQIVKNPLTSLQWIWSSWSFFRNKLSAGLMREQTVSVRTLDSMPTLLDLCLPWKIAGVVSFVLIHLSWSSRKKKTKPGWIHHCFRGF